MVRLKLQYISILFFLLITVAVAQNSRISGKIAGMVKDKETGEVLVGVNVIVDDTFLGASTDQDGFYQILNIPTGTYNLTFSYIGYTVNKVNQVKIKPDYSTTVNVEMKTQYIEGDVIEVTAEKQIIQRDVTASVKEITSEEIRHSPVSNFNQVIAQQIGAVETGRSRRSGGIHIRGGRNNEIVYYVDGVNSNDPFVGTAGVNLDNNAIEQINILSGGFNSEYGESMSGIVQIVTKSGNKEKFSAQFEATSDVMFQGSDYDWGYNKYFASLDGPLPGLKKYGGSFYTQVSYLATDDRNPSIFRQSHNDQQQLNSTAKLHLEPIRSVLKFQLNGSFTQRDEKWYSHGVSANPYWLNQGVGNKAGDNRFSLVMTHTLSPTTWYELTLTRFQNFQRYSPQNGAHFSDWKGLSTSLAWVKEAEDQGWYNRQTGEFTGMSEEEAFYHFYSNKAKTSDGRPYVSLVNGEWKWLDIKLQEEAYDNREFNTGDWYIAENGQLAFREFNIGNYNTFLSDPENSDYEDYDYFGDIDVFAFPYPRDVLGNFILNYTPRWHDRNNKNYTAELAFSSQFNRHNLMKVGGFARYYDLNYTDIQFLNNKPYFDTYSKTPLSLAFYIQDKFDYDDLSINAGLRYDYFDPDAIHPIDLNNLDAGMEKTPPKWQISPRLGIAFAMSATSKMYIHYGQFFQNVDLSDLFQNLNADITNGVPLIGNPNLPPQKETAYEAGFETAINPDVSLKLNTYYKDVQNLLSTDNVNTIFDNTFASYTIYKINDFAKVKGFEIELRKHFGLLSGSLSYGYTDAKGTGSDSRDFYYLFLNSDSELPRKEYPLDFDITHDIKARLNYYIPQNAGPQIFGIKPLQDLNTNFFFTFNTGSAYTPVDSKGNPLEVGSGRLPSQNRLDMRIDKYFKSWKNIELDFFLDVRNVFDVLNVVNIYGLTGKPDDNGYKPIWDPENLGTYADYKKWGYESAYDMYNADLAGWKSFVNNPANYGMPRIIQLGMMIKF